MMGVALYSSSWYVALLLILPVGVVSYLLFIQFLYMRYKNPPANPDFLRMIGDVLQKILVPTRVQVWVRESPHPYIVVTYNPMFDAVIVSEPMIQLMLERPQAGEVLLAFHLARIPRSRWLGDFGGSLILLAIFTYPLALILGPLYISIMSMISYMGILALISLLPLLIYIIIPVLPALIIKGAFWRHEPAFVRIEEVYGMHPQVAKVEVERGTPLSEEETRAVLWGVREWEIKKRSGRRWGISVIIAFVSLILLFQLIWTLIWSWYPYGIPSYYVANIFYLPVVVAAALSGIAYLFLRRWDKKAMGEVFEEVTDSHEPIWMD